MIKKNIWNLIFILSIFVADRLSKILIINSAETFGELDIFVTSFLNFNLIWNDGIAFGLFSFEKKIYYNFLTILIVLITLIILWMITRTEKIEKLAKDKKKEIASLLRTTTEEATTEYFMKSAPQKEEFEKVTITSDYDILAVDDEGDTKLTSMGQSHVLGLSYVFGCRSITEKNTFLFIDSPLHNISGEFRNEVAEVLAKHLPNVQIVLFV